MKQFNDTFERLNIKTIVEQAGREMKEVPKFLKDTSKDGCLSFTLKACPMAPFGKCKRHHYEDVSEVSTEKAKELCKFIRPGLQRMIENKEKFKFLGLRK
jgi:hypothetical protein